MCVQQTLKVIRRSRHEKHEAMTCICQSWRLRECRDSTSVISFTFMASFKSCLLAMMRIAASSRCSCSSSVNSSACRQQFTMLLTVLASLA